MLHGCSPLPGGVAEGHSRKSRAGRGELRENDVCSFRPVHRALHDQSGLSSTCLACLAHSSANSG
jgi:hypothetical protein